MKHLTRILILLTLAALLASCADSTTDTANAGDLQELQFISANR